MDTKFKSLSEFSKREYNILHKYDILEFGKYKNLIIEDIIQKDPQYINWLINNTKYSIDEECLELLKEYL